MQKKLLFGGGVCVLVVAIAAFAFAIGRENGSKEAAPAPGSPSNERLSAHEPEGQAPAQLPCDRREARRALDRGLLGESTPEVVPGERLSDTYEVRLVGCADLTGDGLDELVMQVLWGTSSARSPWAVLSQAEDRWAVEFVRESVVVRSLQMLEDGVRERSAAYRASDPQCCPSATRSGLISFDGKEWAYGAKDAPKALDVTFEDGAASRLAGLSLAELTPDLAREVLGEPSGTFSESQETCVAAWDDLGLRISFVNLGLQDPCSSAGRVGSITLGGVEAQQARWRVDQRARIGSTKTQLRRVYPQMRPSEGSAAQYQDDPFRGKSWVLMEQESPYGEGGMVPTLEARIDGGEVVAFDVWVGAGGE